MCSTCGRYARELLALAQGKMTGCLVEADTMASSAPYAHTLNSLIGHVTTGPTKVFVIEGNVEILGSKQSFDVFASFFNFDEGVSPGTHNHHEYYEGNVYVDSKSVPLVVSVRSSS